VRHVGVVARVLHHGGHGLTVRQRGLGQCERGPVALRQRDLHRVRELAGAQRGAGGLGRRGRAGAGRPAPAQRGALGTHAVTLSRSSRW
jgi:hypothetical protein